MNAELKRDLLGDPGETLTKERAMDIASEYGLQFEVEMMYNEYIKQGMSEHEAWIHALLEWDLI